MASWASVLASVWALSLTSPSAIAGAGSTGGGSVVRDERGVLVSADAYFRARNYQLPDTITGPFAWERYPGLEEEVAALAKFLLQRSIPTGEYLVIGGRAPFELYENLFSQLKGFEIYTASQLSGSDELEVVTGVSAQQVAYSYRFNQLVRGADGRAELNVRRITEIREDLFSQLSRRDQALILIHEWMHLQLGLGHDLISPVLGNLPAVLGVRERQKAAVSEVSAEEYRSLVAFQEGLHAILLTVVGDPEGWSPAFALNRKGGGLLFSIAVGAPVTLLKSGVEENYIDSDSVVQVHYGDDFLGGGRLIGNTIRNSKVHVFSPNLLEANVILNSEVQIRAENPKVYLDGACLTAPFAKNHIVNSFAALTSCGMNDTKIEDSRVHLFGKTSGSHVVDTRMTVKGTSYGHLKGQPVSIELNGPSTISGLRVGAGGGGRGKLRLSAPATIREVEIGLGAVSVDASQIQLEGLKIRNHSEVRISASAAGAPLSVQGGTIQLRDGFKTEIQLSSGVKNWNGRTFDFSSRKPRPFQKSVILSDRDFR